MDRNLKLLAIVLGLSVATAALMSQVQVPQRPQQAVGVDGPPPPPPGSIAEPGNAPRREVEAPVYEQEMPEFGQPMASASPPGWGSPGDKGDKPDERGPGGDAIADGAPVRQQGFAPSASDGPPEFPRELAEGGGASLPQPAPVILSNGE